MPRIPSLGLPKRGYAPTRAAPVPKTCCSALVVVAATLCLYEILTEPLRLSTFTRHVQVFVFVVFKGCYWFMEIPSLSFSFKTLILQRLWLHANT